MKNQVFNSWEIINEMTIIKKADWSFFKYNGSGIPKATRNYWISITYHLERNYISF